MPRTRYAEAAAWRSASSALSSFLDNLPIIVFGNSARNSISAGISIFEILGSRWASRSSAVSDGTITQFHEGLRGLAAIVILDADHRRLFDVRVIVEGFLDHAWINVIAGTNDEILDPVDNEEEAFVVHDRNIAGSEETVDKRVLRRLRLVPVAFHDLWAADADLTAFTLRNRNRRVVQITQGNRGLRHRLGRCSFP